MNVLIVDDDPVNVAILKLILDDIPEVRTQCFTSTRTALDWCARADVDLVVIDYMLAAPDGVAFIQEFRQLKGKAEVPVVMITANRRRRVRYAALEAGANDFLDKPIDRIEFLARIRNMLAWRKTQKLLDARITWLARELRTCDAQRCPRCGHALEGERAAEHR